MRLCIPARGTSLGRARPRYKTLPHKRTRHFLLSKNTILLLLYTRNVLTLSLTQ